MRDPKTQCSIPVASDPAASPPVHAGLHALRWAVLTPSAICCCPHLCRREPRFVPAASLAQVSRWSAVLLSQLFRGAVDFGRPADIALYHIGCFQLRFPDGGSIPLAAVVLHGLQQQSNQ